MSNTNRPLRVFLSHSHGDSEIVGALYNRLIKDGVDAWVDEKKLLPGQHWESEIAKAIRNCDVFIALFSGHGFSKEGYIQKEMKLALDIANGKTTENYFLIPARLDDNAPSESLMSTQAVNLFESNGYENLLNLLKAQADQIGLKLQPDNSVSETIPIIPPWRPMFVDREPQRLLFLRLINQEIPQRIILISGEGGVGKSSLLHSYREICNETDTQNAFVSFRFSPTNPIQVMLKIYEDLGWGKFISLETALKDIQVNPNTSIEPLYLNPDTQYAFSSFSFEEGFEHKVAITKAFFQDISRYMESRKRVVFLFDDFEIAGLGTQSWLSREFMISLTRTDGVFAVIAGRDVPKPINDLGHWYTSVELGGIERKYWQEYARQSSIEISPETLNSLSKATSGLALLMASFLTHIAVEKGKTK
jgi:hypothetical protein